MVKASIYFETGSMNMANKKSLWWVYKEFNDDKHLDNFINYIIRTKGYLLDEVHIL
jgi:hypothetical protein